MAAIVPLDPRHAAGFRTLVASTLAEFGFTEDPVIDADLLDPRAAYDAVWIAEEDGRVIGSVAMRLVADGREAELKRMYLEPSARGRGLGRRLLEQALAWASDRRVHAVVLDTATDMRAAQRLYESAGFRRSGTRTEVGAHDSRCEILYRRDLRPGSDPGRGRAVLRRRPHAELHEVAIAQSRLTEAAPELSLEPREMQQVRHVLEADRRAIARP